MGTGDISEPEKSGNNFTLIALIFSSDDYCTSRGYGFNWRSYLLDKL